MKKLAALMLATLMLALSTPVFAGSCPRLWKQVDETLAAGTSVSADVLAKVKALRAKGEADHKAGQHAASEAALREALKLLGK